MFEGFYNKKSRSESSRKIFDEGRDIDTGETDPTTGERKIIDMEPFSQDDENEEGNTLAFKKETKTKEGNCKYCGGDPCKPDCDYR